MLFKNFKKYPKKKKIRVIITAVVILSLIAVVIYEVYKPDALPEYDVVTAQSGTINQTYIATGTVESNSTTDFKIIDGAKVAEVFVSVGDEVKDGQLLATFDTSSLSGKLSALLSEYNQAKAKYDDAVSSSKNATNQLSSINSQIASLEKQIASLEKDIEATKVKESEALKVTGPVSYTGSRYTAQQIEAMSQQILLNGGTQEQVYTMIAALNAIEATQGMTEEQLTAVLANTSAAKSLQLTQLNSQLASLKTQKSVYEMQTENTLASAYKSVADVKYKEYESVKNAIELMKQGWKAEGRGIVTEVNIKAGEAFSSNSKKASSNASYTDLLNMLGSGSTDISSVISQLVASSADNGNSGIKVENYDEFIASFSVGKYDLLSLKVGQKATISSLNSNFDGEVSYVGATASESSSFDISSLTSSLTGGSNSSNSALAKVKIINPDEKIIIGFDVDVAVNIKTLDNVLVVPVEALKFEDGKKYVFVYNEQTKTVKKQEVELGVSEDTKYQVTNGIGDGDKVIKNPLATLNDGDKIAMKTTTSTKK